MASTRATLRQVAGAAEIRTGSVTVDVLDTSATVEFDAEMGGSDYKVGLTANGISAALAVESKTTEGFDITFTAGISGVIEYIAARNL
jgi:hypothetical protein